MNEKGGSNENYQGREYTENLFHSRKPYETHNERLFCEFTKKTLVYVEGLLY